MILRCFTIVSGGLHEATLRHCSDCDFGYFYPLPSSDFFEKYYATESNTHGRNLEALTATWMANKGLIFNGHSFEGVFTFLEGVGVDLDKIRQGRAIEIGCGSGEFIDYANQHGFKFEGLDPVKVNCDFLEKNLKTKTFCCMVDQMPESENGAFELVYSAHSLEHHKSPLKTLQKFYELLKPGGTLFIALPNLNSYTLQNLPMEHLYFSFPPHVNYFSARSFEKTLCRLGFAKVHTTTTTYADQLLWCCDAAIRLGLYSMEPGFYNELTKKKQHETLLVCATK